MQPDVPDEWHKVIRAATESVKSAPFADLQPARAGIALTRYASVVAAPHSLDAAVRWMAITEAVIAVGDDLAFACGHQPVIIPLPDAPVPETPELLAAFHELWVAIVDGIDRYMISVNDNQMLICASATARGLLQLIEVGAGSRR